MNGKNAKYHMDEMQEFQLLRLEERGFWITFWALCASVVVQALAGTGLREIAGELAALLIAGGCIMVFCLKNGLWARNYKPSLKMNAAFSAAAALALGAVFALRAFVVLRKPVSFELAWRIALLMVIGYGACFGLLELARAVYKKMRQRLDDTEERGR